MQTFLLLQLDSEGAAFSHIADLLEDLGFRPQGSGYDFVYDWEPTGHRPRVPRVRRPDPGGPAGSKVYFRIESSDE